MEEAKMIVVYLFMVLAFFTIAFAGINYYEMKKLERQVEKINNHIRKQIDEIDGILYDKYKKR